MSKVFPSPFRARQWGLTALALVAATAALLLANASGLGAGGAIFISVVAGTILFVVIAGRDRVFFTGLFTGALSAGMSVWSAVDSIFTAHEAWSRDLVLLPCLLFLFYMLIPITFAWLVTCVVRWLAGHSRRDDNTK